MASEQKQQNLSITIKVYFYKRKTEVTMCQFHQLYCAKCKCVGSRSSAQVVAVRSHQISNKFSTPLEITLNSYALRSTSGVSKYFRSRATLRHYLCLAGHIAVKKAPFKLKKSPFAGHMLPPYWRKICPWNVDEIEPSWISLIFCQSSISLYWPVFSIFVLSLFHLKPIGKILSSCFLFFSYKNYSSFESKIVFRRLKLGVWGRKIKRN